MRKTPLIVLAVAVLAIIVLFVSCQNGEKSSPEPSPVPAPTPSTSAPAPEPPAPAPTATPSPTAPALSGYVTGECEIDGYAIHCTVDQVLTLDRAGRAFYDTHAVLVTCDENVCTSTRSTAQQGACLYDEDGIFCLNVSEQVRAEIRSAMLTYRTHCSLDRRTDLVNCSFPAEWQTLENQPVVNGVPLMLGTLDNRLGVYAGQLALGYEGFTCVPTVSDNPAEQATVCSN